MEKNLPQAILTLCGFVVLANLPFLTISYGLGIDTFLDSFEHPNSFYYIKNEKIQTSAPEGGYLILEKPTYQGFSIKEGDIILCYTAIHTIQQTVVNKISYADGIAIYYISTSDTNTLDAPIYDHQIVGKIKGCFEDNVWNRLCLYVWDLSIDNLNVLSLFLSP